jgi:hypothetical protein
MKVYTIKNKQGKLLPMAILKVENIGDAVVDKQIVNVDYGLEAVKEYLQTPSGKEFELAICELQEIIE